MVEAAAAGTKLSESAPGSRVRRPVGTVPTHTHTHTRCIDVYLESRNASLRVLRAVSAVMVVLVCVGNVWIQMCTRVGGVVTCVGGGWRAPVGGADGPL